MFTSSSACSFGEIMTVSGNVPSAICLIALIPSTGFISVIIAIFLARRMPSCFPFLLFLRVQSVLPIGCSIGYADPSPFLNIIDRMFLARFSSDRIINLTLNFLYLESNIIFTFLRLAFINSIFIKVFFYISVITRAFLLITFYIIFRSVFQLFYQISASYNIIEYTVVIWILRVNSEASLYFFIIPYILITTFFAFSIF